MERIVCNNFIMPYLLEWQYGCVTEIVPFLFNHARCQVEIAETEPGIAPGGIPAQHGRGSPLTVAGIGHRPVGGIPVGMDILVRKPSVPDPSAQIAVRGQGIGRETVVCLIL